MTSTAGGSKSMMRVEIDEQPSALTRTYRDLAPAAARVHARLDDARSVLFLARGSSDHAATYGRYLVPIAVGKPASSGAPSLATLYNAQLDLQDTLAFVISQSGETEELLEAAAWARERGAVTVALTNTPSSALIDACDEALVTSAGAERAVPATKSFTAQLLALAMVARPDWADDLASVGDRIEGLLTRLAGPSGLDEAVTLLAHARTVVCTGRGYSLSAAGEAALKLTETTGMPCAGMSHADLQHGPIAMLGADVPLLVFAACDGPALSGLSAVAETARERGSSVVHIGGGPSGHLPGGDGPEALSPIGLSVVAQVIAEAVARARGLNPDRPAGLTKVTQTSR